MTILIDMDGVLANMEKGFYDTWRTKHPGLVSVHPEARTDHDLRKDYADYSPTLIYDILGGPGFFRNLEPYQEGIAAVKEMLEMDLDPTICTAHMSYSTTCPMEKLEWIEEHLGREWIKRVIITKDKTKVVGKVLIDDHVQKGVYTPQWKQLMLTRPYNKSLPMPHRITWETWKQDIQEFM